MVVVCDANPQSLSKSGEWMTTLWTTLAGLLITNLLPRLHPHLRTQFPPIMSGSLKPPKLRMPKLTLITPLTITNQRWMDSAFLIPRAHLVQFSENLNRKQPLFVSCG